MVISHYGTAAAAVYSRALPGRVASRRLYNYYYYFRIHAVVNYSAMHWEEGKSAHCLGTAICGVSHVLQDGGLPCIRYPGRRQNIHWMTILSEVEGGKTFIGGPYYQKLPGCTSTL